MAAGMEAMSDKDEKARKALQRLDEAFVEDIFETSDQEILAEFEKRHGNPAQYAVTMRARFEKTVLNANKSRLKAARAALDAAASRPHQAAEVIDIAEARRKLRGVLSSGTAAGKLTIAARNENELSDADILTMITNLRELGLWPEDKDNS
jgi:hypothetical protein